MTDTQTEAHTQPADAARAAAPSRGTAPVRTPLRRHLERTGHAARHSGDPATWRHAFRMAPPSPSLIPALRVGTATAVVLLIGGATGHQTAAALAGLGALTSAFARGEPYRRRGGKTAVAAVLIIAAMTLGSTLAGAPAVAQIAVLSLAGGIGAWVLSALRITGPGAVVIVFAGAAAAMTADLAVAVTATVLGAAVGWVCAMAPVRAAPDRAAGPERRWIRSGVPRLSSGEFAWVGLRITAASFIAGAIALSTGLAHPLWASMGATAALQSVTFSSTVQRSIQRLAGNITGAAIALALIAAGMGFSATAAVIVALQFVTELTIARNYALATTAITPMALLMMGLGGELTPAMAFSRIGDTAVGVLVGLVVAAASIHPNDRGHVVS